MKIRVIHMAEDLRTGGIEHVIHGIATGLDKTKFEVEVWGLVSGGAVADRLVADKIPVRILSVKNCYSPAAIIKTALLLKKTRASIVHTHSYFANTLGRISAIIAGIPVKIVHHHSTFHDMSRLNVFVDRFLNLFTNKVVYVSKGVQQTFAYAGYDISRTEVIYNGIDPLPYEQKSVERQKNIITIVASLTMHKGHRFLLEAMKQVIDRVPDARLWIVGDGPLRVELEEQSQHLGISGNVQFLGLRNDIPDILLQSTVFALASTREGLPMTIIEAMAAALPVVAPNISGIPELVIDNSTGLLVPPADSQALASALLKLLRDPSVAETMGQKGKIRFTEMFTNVKIMQELKTLYMRLLEAKGKHLNEYPGNQKLLKTRSS